MTHEIVPGDIELATRLLKAGCQDSGIIAELCWRGAGEKQAAQLVEALRRGQKVQVTLTTGPSHRSQHRRDPAAPGLPGLPQPEGIRRKRSRRSARDRGVKPADLVSVALFLAVAIGLLYLFVADVGTVPGRENQGGSVVQTDDFKKAAKDLTNGVSH
jgi:hypothetical protein